MTWGPSSDTSGGARTEYAGVWWLRSHRPFQMVKLLRLKNSARKMCVVRSGVRGLRIMQR